MTAGDRVRVLFDRGVVQHARYVEPADDGVNLIVEIDGRLLSLPIEKVAPLEVTT